MSLPPATPPPVSDTVAIRRGARRPALLMLALTLALSAAYLLIDIALDPALLPHMARAGHLLALLVLVGWGFFGGFCVLVEMESKRPRVERTLNLLSGLLAGPMLPIWAIAWLDPYLPNMRYGALAVTGMGVANIGITLCVLSLRYGILAARKRHETEEAYAGRGIPAREQVVGFESLARAVTVIWVLVVASASIYGMWLSLTNDSDSTALVQSLALVGGAMVLIFVPFFWLLHRTRRYAHQTGDAALLASARVPSARQAATQRLVVPPDERPRWGVSLLVGLGLVAFSLLTFAVLDFRLVQSSYADGSQRWLISVFIPFLSWMGLHRASARRYQLERFRWLLVAAAMLVVAGDAMLVDMTHPHHSIVPPLGLLAIAVLCSTYGVLICRSLLLHPMWEGNTAPNGATPPMLAASHDAPLAGGQKRPRVAPYLILLLPVFIVVEHLLNYGDASMRREWESIAYNAVMLFITVPLAEVVNTDMSQWKAQRPAKKGA